MKKFLLVLSDIDAEGNWGRRLSEELEEKGAEVKLINKVEEAERLLSGQRYSADEVICGSFGGVEDGDWRRAWEAAKKVGVRMTLLSAGFNSRRLQTLQEMGVGAIEKDTFNLDAFLEERFPSSGLKERER